MNVNRILPVRDGEVLKTFQDFLAAWWRRLELDAMLAPMELPGHAGVSPQVITDPADLCNVNPFAPVMLSNSATLVEPFVNDHPGAHLAAVLRPCELRALVEIEKRHRTHYQRTLSSNGHGDLTIIGVDCPGTFAPSEYAQHVAQHEADAEMIRINLAYGRQESYIPRQVREACQVCDTPAPMSADIVIGTIGIVPQGNILVITRNEDLDSKLKVQDVTEGLASEEQVVCREQMVRKLVEEREERRAEVIKFHLSDTEEPDLPLALFARCTLCADCLDVCPIYEGELSGMLGVGEAHRRANLLLSELVNLSRWLASCSGCGMCQEACEHGVLLTPVVTGLSHRIQKQLHYKPGDPAQPLPWTI
jgi:formate dehydrogenase (coenzyme F420) beta subunit